MIPLGGGPLGAGIRGLLVPPPIPLSISKSSLISACFSLCAVMTPLGESGSSLCAGNNAHHMGRKSLRRVCAYRMATLLRQGLRAFVLCGSSAFQYCKANLLFICFIEHFVTGLITC